MTGMTRAAKATAKTRATPKRPDYLKHKHPPAFWRVFAQIASKCSIRGQFSRLTQLGKNNTFY
jgi:hypothetical protein